MKNKNLLIDTHAHVNFSDFKKDYKEVIKRALDEGAGMIIVGAYGDASKRAVEIAEEYESGVYAAVGQHPGTKEEFNYDYFLKLAKHEKVVGIGECGLEYFHIKDEQAHQRQKDIFAKHIELAKEVKKPLIIHCREAHDDLLKLLYANSHNLNTNAGAMHFFTGTLEQAKKYIELGFYISFSGVITFLPLRRANANAYDEVVKNIPLEKILIETDCPYAAPVPHRGKRNEPQYVKYVAQKIAEIKELPFEEVAEQTTQNARELFKI